MKPVLIVGAGLAGLTCARALRRKGLPFLIIEADDRMGGRLKTDNTGEFNLDRGYQTYLTAYPHAAPQIDEDKLDLKPLNPGGYVIWDGEQCLVSRERPMRFAISGLFSLSDKLRLGRWTSDVQWLDQADIDEIPDRTSEQYLLDEGFSDDFIDRFARPFLGTLFLDRSLSTSCRQLLFMWKAITEGEVAIPALGMEQIPKQMGATFGHGVLKLNTKVAGLLPGGGVVLNDGSEIAADQVVLACDAANASRLSGVPIEVVGKHAITLYFSASESPVDGAWAVYNGNVRGITNHVVPISNVVGSGSPLISATILGERPESDEQLAEIVKSEMRVWFPNHDSEAWKFLRAYRLQNAVLAQPPGFQTKLPGNDSGLAGIYFAGEFTTNSSIDGAIQSGLECAEFVVSQTVVGAA